MGTYPQSGSIEYFSSYTLAELQEMALGLASFDGSPFDGFEARVIVSTDGSVYLEVGGQRRDLKPSLPCGQANARNVTPTTLG